LPSSPRRRTEKGFWGSEDAGGSETSLEVWLRQRGKALYDKDGKLGFGAGEAGEWLAFWDDMRKRKACRSGRRPGARPRQL